MIKQSLGWATAIVAALVLSACGPREPFDTAGTDSVVVGSADFAESELLMEIYAAALRSTGADVETRGRIGARELYVDAVRSGELSVIPDYTGNLLQHVDPAAQATGSEEVYAALRERLGPGLRVLEPSPAEDSDVLAVTPRTAESGVRSMTDLGPRCGEFVLGAPAEWKSRWEARIAEVYGCEFERIRSVEAGSVTVDALTSGKIQVANLFTTSSAIEANDLVALDDPREMFPAQNVVPLVGRGELDQTQVDVLDQVSRALSTEKLAELNRRLEVDKENPADVAEEFVAEAGI
ncbi:ABC transporter substrate-binding protein [Parasphingorhabdus pacifica]